MEKFYGCDPGNGGNIDGGNFRPQGGRGGNGPVVILENTVLTYPERMEPVTECNCCEYYRRGECSLSGLSMTPDDYCSKAVRAEA